MHFPRWQSWHYDSVARSLSSFIIATLDSTRISHAKKSPTCTLPPFFIPKELQQSSFQIQVCLSSLCWHKSLYLKQPLQAADSKTRPAAPATKEQSIVCIDIWLSYHRLLSPKHIVFEISFILATVGIPLCRFASSRLMCTSAGLSTSYLGFSHRPSHESVSVFQLWWQLLNTKKSDGTIDPSS